MDLSDVNWLAVIVASVVSFVIGAIWYSPMLFSKMWQKEVGMSDSEFQGGNMVAIFGSSLVMMFVMVLGLAWVLPMMEGTLDWMFGLTRGALLGLFFVAPSIAINIFYQRKTWRLWMIDAGYQVLYMAVAGAIIGFWS